MKAWRVGCAVAQILVVEALVCAVAALPIVALWMWLVERASDALLARMLLIALFIVPSYVVFALLLMACSALANRITNARTPDGVELRIADMEWPLLRWVRYMVATHIVRIFAGYLFRGSPIWTTYLRLNGARIGRGVYVNTLSIADHNLLEFGDGVILGDGVHVSGHTVERGILKTGRVTLHRGVTVGIGTIIDIDVEAGAGCQIGALSLVPKHTRLDPEAVYVGVPAVKLDSR